MKPPSWMVVKIVPYDKMTVRAYVHVRKWHPGFWLWFVRRWVGRFREARKRRKL